MDLQIVAVRYYTHISHTTAWAHLSQKGAFHITTTNKVCRLCKVHVRNLFLKNASLLSYVATENQKRTCSLNLLQSSWSSSCPH